MGFVVIHLVYITNPLFGFGWWHGHRWGRPFTFWTAILGFVSYLHAKVLCVQCLLWSIFYLWMILEVCKYLRLVYTVLTEWHILLWLQLSTYRICHTLLYCILLMSNMAYNLSSLSTQKVLVKVFEQIPSGNSCKHLEVTLQWCDQEDGPTHPPGSWKV